MAIAVHLTTLQNFVTIGQRDPELSDGLFWGLVTGPCHIGII